jgi:hypothetical protein
VANVRDTKLEQAAARRRHPGGKAAPAQAKAAAKAPAKKTAPRATSPPAKIKWTPQGERDEHGDCESVGTSGDHEYAITRQADGTWRPWGWTGDLDRATWWFWSDGAMHL